MLFGMCEYVGFEKRIYLFWNFFVKKEKEIYVIFVKVLFVIFIVLNLMVLWEGKEFYFFRGIISYCGNDKDFVINIGYG